MQFRNALVKKYDRSVFEIVKQKKTCIDIFFHTCSIHHCVAKALISIANSIGLLRHLFYHFRDDYRLQSELAVFSAQVHSILLVWRNRTRFVIC